MLNFFTRTEAAIPSLLDYSEMIEIDNRTMLERNIDSFRQVRDAHNLLIEELDMQIAERQDERRQALATVAMCDAALATVEPIE